MLGCNLCSDHVRDVFFACVPQARSRTCKTTPNLPTFRPPCAAGRGHEGGAAGAGCRRLPNRNHSDDRYHGEGAHQGVAWG